MKWTYAMLFVMLGACGPAGADLPEGVLERERFKTVLLEAQLIEARMNHELIVRHLTDIPSESYYVAMFAEHGITKEQFDRSFAFYAEDPQTMKAIYEEILVELSRRKDEQPQ
jgi:hypothetical protein